MAAVFEHAAFTTREGHEQALLDERPAMIAALRRAFPGLVGSWLTRRDDGSWLDVILWRTRDDADYSARHVTEVAEAVAWFSHIEQSHGIEHLTVLHSDSPELHAKRHVGRWPWAVVRARFRCGMALVARRISRCPQDGVSSTDRARLMRRLTCGASLERMTFFHRIAQRAKAIRSRIDLGMTTAEYAVGTVAAVAFAAVLYKVVQSDAVSSALSSIVTSALHAI